MQVLNTAIPSATMKTCGTFSCGPIPGLICRIFMRIRGTNQDQVRMSRCTKPNAAWLHSESASCVIIIKSNNTIGVIPSVHEIEESVRKFGEDISTQGKSDRAISPNTMNEEDRRELIARQHRALYGNESSPYSESANYGDDSTPRASVSTSATNTAGGKGPSPYDTHAIGQGQIQNTGDIGGLSVNEHGPSGPSPRTQQGRSRADSTSSPASNPPSQNFSMFENAAQQSSRTSTSSPGGSPPRQAKTSNPGVAPIGTRPVQGQSQNAGLTKRSTTSSPSPLGYNFSNNEHQSLNAATNSNERSTSSASNKDSNMNSSNTWGTGSGVWGNKSLHTQASVWG